MNGTQSACSVMSLQSKWALSPRWMSDWKNWCVDSFSSEFSVCVWRAMNTKGFFVCVYFTRMIGYNAIHPPSCTIKSNVEWGTPSNETEPIGVKWFWCTQTVFFYFAEYSSLTRPKVFEGNGPSFSQARNDNYIGERMINDEDDTIKNEREDERGGWMGLFDGYTEHRKRATMKMCQFAARANIILFSHYVIDTTTQFCAYEKHIKWG